MEYERDLFKAILVPVDFSPCSDEAFRVACQVARLCGARLLVLHVIDTSALAAFNRLGLLAVPSDAAPQRRRLRHHARLNVRQLLESKVALDVKITRLIVEGAPFVEIAKVARTGDIDLVVIGSYGGRSGSVDKIFFGSTAEKVVRTAGCPVLTVPLPTSAPRQKSTR
ncbi:universal stress protein [Candidatus Nitrospira nitrificans]|uniref:Putative Universal stress protein n=1 Tax=Candidatus Nitrospira nitrificans TaxID=1742973 RepID=A0A0S4LMT7_9BACT|nr:universal stress protein [Candidatus Nitrospira nitrificans]CUS37243.1 putative Universal stress protein [Candidatus Nitrospira nitrificans]